MLIRAFLILSALILTAKAAYGQPKQLSLNAAIQAALENNANVQISEEQEVQARARSLEQRATFLPNIDGLISHANHTINLVARGFDFPGLPRLVGPFDNNEARVRFVEPVDLSLIRRYQSLKRAADSSELDTLAVKNQVAAMVARLYFNVVRAGSLIEAAQAQINLDESLLKLARDRHEVGVGTLLDVTRAQSRLAVNQYRLNQAQNERRTAELQLLRSMGEGLDQQIELTDGLAATSLNVLPPAEALKIAVQNRPELQAEGKRLEAARLLVGAARAESVPSLRAFADYGNSGNRDAFIPTRTFGLEINVPIFDSGRRDARRLSAQSQMRQAEVRAKDVRDEVELEVRVSLDNLDSAREQLRSTEEGLRLAQEELDLSRLRFENQVSTQIDVINAQVELSLARFRQVQALFTLRVAEVEYQRAAGLEIR